MAAVKPDTANGPGSVAGQRAQRGPATLATPGRLREGPEGSGKVDEPFVVRTSSHRLHHIENDYHLSQWCWPPDRAAFLVDTRVETMFSDLWSKGSRLIASFVDRPTTL